MLTVTLVIAGACALISIWLGLRVVQIRRTAGISIGDGGDARLAARMRAQMNFVEYAPFVLILMALIELAEGSSLWLWAAGALFVVGRIAHAFGMDGWRAGRMGGTIVTLLLLLVLGIYAAVLPFEGGGVATPEQGVEVAPAAG